MLEREMKLRAIFQTKYSVDKWSKIVHLLGIFPDKKLAKKIGVTQNRVAQVRGQLGIGPVRFPVLAEKYGYLYIGQGVVVNE